MNVAALKRGFRYEVSSPSGKVKIQVRYFGRKLRGSRLTDVYIVEVNGNFGSMERTGIASTRNYINQLIERFKNM